MEALEYLIISLLSTLILLVFFIVYTKYMFKPFAPILNMVSTDSFPKSIGNIERFLDDVNYIADALEDDEKLSEIATVFSQKFKTIMTMSLLGVKSADKRKMKKAEEAVDKMITQSVMNIHPLLKKAIEYAGLEDELNDPEFLGYMLIAAENKGLLEQLGGMLGNMDPSSLLGGTPTKSDADTVRETIIKDYKT